MQASDASRNHRIGSVKRLQKSPSRGRDFRSEPHAGAQTHAHATDIDLLGGKPDLGAVDGGR